MTAEKVLIRLIELLLEYVEELKDFKETKEKVINETKKVLFQ